MHDPGVVDQDGDGAECRLDGIESAVDGRAVKHIGLDRDGAAARRLDPRLHCGEPLAAARYEPDGGTVRRQHLREPRPQAARRAGHERDPAGEIEQFRCFHDNPLPRPAQDVRPHVRGKSHSPNCARRIRENPIPDPAASGLQVATILRRAKKLYIRTKLRSLCMTDQITADKVPVTVLTGYLGAGKTTLLNRILSEPHGRKYAVIVNEFGEIGVDNDLIVGADEEIFEMNNGCICCTVRGDLIRIIQGLMRRKGKFDAIIVETTGLADPAPVAQTFFVDEEIGRKAKLDAVVTVADARWLKDRLRDAPEAKNQIAFADVILINKTDLVVDADLEEVEARIRGINPYAKLHRTERCKVALSDVLERGAFDLDRILDIEPAFLER